MIDLHTHSLFSDGELIPSELARRFESLGYAAIAITDHADSSTLDFIVPRIVHVAEDLNQSQSVRVIPGIELTPQAESFAIVSSASPSWHPRVDRSTEICSGSRLPSGLPVATQGTGSAVTSAFSRVRNRPALHLCFLGGIVARSDRQPRRSWRTFTSQD